jgi:hypothetical protein
VDQGKASGFLYNVDQAAKAKEVVEDIRDAIIEYQMRARVGGHSISGQKRKKRRSASEKAEGQEYRAGRDPLYRYSRGGGEEELPTLQEERPPVCADSREADRLKFVSLS